MAIEATVGVCCIFNGQQYILLSFNLMVSNHTCDGTLTMNIFAASEILSVWKLVDRGTL